MAAPAGWYPDPDNDNFVRWWDGERWTHHTDLRKPEEFPSQIPQRIEDNRVPPYNFDTKPVRPPKVINIRKHASGLVLPGISLDETGRDVVDLPGAQEVGTKGGSFRVPSFRKNRQGIHKFRLQLIGYRDGNYDVAVTYKGKTFGHLTDFWLPIYLPFFLQLEREGRDIIVDGREYNSIGGRNVMIFLPKPEEFAIWLDTPAHLRRAKPPKLEESGAYLHNVGEQTDFLMGLLGRKPSHHSDAVFTFQRVAYGDYAGMAVISVYIDNQLVGSLQPWYAEQFPSFYESVVEKEYREGRVYIDRLGKQSGINHKGLRVIAFVPFN